MPKYRIFFERQETISFLIDAPDEWAAIQQAQSEPQENAETRAYGKWEFRDDITEEVED